MNTPFFIANPDADRADAIDAAFARLDQAAAAIACLMASGDNGEFALTHKYVTNLLWGVQEQIEQAQAALWHHCQLTGKERAQ